MLFLDEQRQVYKEERATYETASGEHGVCHQVHPRLKSQGPRPARTEPGEEPGGTLAEQAITLPGEVPGSLRAQFSRRHCLRLALIHPMDQDTQIYTLLIFQ